MGGRPDGVSFRQKGTNQPDGRSPLIQTQVTATIVIAVPPAPSDLNGVPAWVTWRLSTCVSEIDPAPVVNALVLTVACSRRGVLSRAIAFASGPKATIPRSFPPRTSEVMRVFGLR